MGETNSNQEKETVICHIPFCSKEVPYKYMDEILTKSTKMDIIRVARDPQGSVPEKEVTLYDCGCIRDTEYKDNIIRVSYNCQHCLLNESLKNLKLNHMSNILQKS